MCDAPSSMDRKPTRPNLKTLGGVEVWLTWPPLARMPVQTMVCSPGNWVGSDLPCEAFPTRIAPAGHYSGVIIETINVGANRREAPGTRGAVVERNGNFGEPSDLESSVGAAVPLRMSYIVLLSMWGRI